MFLYGSNILGFVNGRRFFLPRGLGESKVQPRIGHEGPEGE